MQAAPNITHFIWDSSDTPAYTQRAVIAMHSLITLKALPHQWVAVETANLKSLRSRMLTSVSPFLFMSLLTVSMYRNFGLPIGLIPSTTRSSTVQVVWLSSLRLTCPYQRSRFCIRCVAIGWTVSFPDLFIYVVLSHANALYPSQHSHFSLIHQLLILRFHYLAFSHICHSRSYNSLIDFMFELDGCFLVTDDSS